MREILFRGKRADNGEWVEGYYKLCGHLLGTIEEDIYPTITPFNQYGYIADPKTVGQFTGRVDKNEKQVFEGDILRVNVDGQDWGVGVVQWCDHDQCFSLFTSPDSNNRLIDFGDLGLPEYYEIIGNIYDNPELLGGADNG